VRYIVEEPNQLLFYRQMREMFDVRVTCVAEESERDALLLDQLGNNLPDRFLILSHGNCHTSNTSKAFDQQPCARSLSA
jgi:hypothetical protein